MQKRKVKIKSWEELKASSHSSTPEMVYAPIGSQCPMYMEMYWALPKDRIITLNSCSIWKPKENPSANWYFEEWMIAEEIKPDAIEDQAQAHGEGKLILNKEV